MRALRGKLETLAVDRDIHARSCEHRTPAGDGLRIVGEANRNLPAGCLGIDHAIYRFTDGRSYAAGKD